MRKNSTLILSFIFSAIVNFYFPIGLNALPLNWEITVGEAFMERTSPDSLTIEQKTDQLSVSYRDFSVEKGEKLDFQQPNVASQADIQVTGDEPSSISGKITGNGEVVIKNRKGFIFKSGANFQVKKLTFAVKS